MTSCGSFSAKTVEGKQTVRLTRIVGPGVSVQVSGFSSDFLTPETSYAILCSLTTEREHGMAHGKSKLQIYYDLFDSVKFREKSVVNQNRVAFLFKLVAFQARGGADT